MFFNNNDINNTKIIFIKLLALLFVLLTFSCQDNLEEESEDQKQVTMENLKASPTFNWKNTQQSNVNIKTKDYQGNPIPKVKVSIWTDYEENNGKEILSGATNEQGEFTLDYNFASDVNELVLKTDFLGFISETKVSLENGAINFTYGGSPEQQSGRNSGSSNTKSVYTDVGNTANTTLSENTTINFLGSYNASGVPDYLEAERDVVSNDFLQDVNNALPENNPVPEYHPEYLAGNRTHNLIVSDSAEVWVTFVSEGAAYRSALAFYTYDRDFPPSSPEDIDEVTVIFPNASFNGSGGGLVSGDKVSLGTFQEGTVIGWVLIKNGFNASSAEVTEGLGLLYSNLELNPEQNVENKQHTVMLYDETRELFLTSFEDLPRPYGDNDFNDLVFYASANPIENIETGNVATIDKNPLDSDNDGINDNFDDYPDDPERAFNNYYPSKELYGSLAFEDLWPSKGDYDFNDLVVDYNFNRILNAENKVVELEGKFIVRAMGANFENGFGFTIDGISSSAVSSVTGANYTEGYIQNNGNGTEAGQDDATIIVLDNAKENGYSNTLQDQPFIAADTISINIDLVSPTDANEFGIAPYNPFIIVGKERGREVHLPNYKPSDLADSSLFGGSFDDTQAQTGKYYKTQDNLPWAVNFPSKFNYPVERKSIDKAHLRFIDWVLSDGLDFRDWYKNNPGFRNTSNIYSE